MTKLETVKEIPGAEIVLLDGQIHAVIVGEYRIERADGYSQWLRILAPAKPKLVERFQAVLDVAGKPVVLGIFGDAHDAVAALREIGALSDKTRVESIEVEEA